MARAIDHVHAALRRGQMTARGLFEAYLGRIEALDRDGPTRHAILAIDPDALAAADRLPAR
jgi:amidase